MRLPAPAMPQRSWLKLYIVYSKPRPTSPMTCQRQRQGCRCHARPYNTTTMLRGAKRTTPRPRRVACRLMQELTGAVGIATVKPGTKPLKVRGIDRMPKLVLFFLQNLCVQSLTVALRSVLAWTDAMHRAQFRRNLAGGQADATHVLHGHVHVVESHVSRTGRGRVRRLDGLGAHVLTCMSPRASCGCWRESSPIHSFSCGCIFDRLRWGAIS